MAFIILIKGIIVGFCAAVPVGPIGILCIRRSLADGQKIGMATGLGAATADAIYGCVAYFGLTAVSNFLIGQKLWLGLPGGLFVCGLGIGTFFKKPTEQKTTAGAHIGSLFSAYLSSLFLTLTNPTTIFSFMAIFASVGLGVSPTLFNTVGLTAGMFIGSALWWLFLSISVSLFRSQINPGRMLLINRLAGIIILVFGLYLLWTALFR
jgi:threonine/homoserine/homoserine lactone efflux protein